MKLKRLFVFALPLLTMGITSCGGGGSSSEPETSSSEEIPSEEVPSAKSYSGDLPRFDPSKYKDHAIFHYHRYDGDYDNWALWLWDHGNGGEGSQYAPVAYDDYGAVFAEPLSTWSPGNWSKLDIGFIVKAKDSWVKDPENSGDRFLVLSDYPMDDNGNYSIWLWTEMDTTYDHEIAVPYYLRQVSFDDLNTLYVLSGMGYVKNIKLFRDGNKIQEWTFTGSQIRRSFTLKLDETASLEHTYRVEATYLNDTILSSPVDVSTLYETKEFHDLYDYEGELGAIYTKTKTTFRVWSPISTSVKVRLYDNGTPKSLDGVRGDDTFVEFDMVKGEKGTWSYEYEGDADGKYYTYVVNNYKFKNKEIVDPYAKAAGVNGVRGMVLDFAKTDPEGWDEFDVALPYEQSSLTVYETHVVDVTSHKTWGGNPELAKTYLGMAQEGTVYDAGELGVVSTGFDHIKELGVNAVQLQPMFDHANDEREGRVKFNWGYNPLNYNVLEGSYSTNAYDGRVRVNEFKQLVQAYHKEGINVIMDVVYNHVNSVDAQNFDVLAPGYFFRYTGSGALSNGSGCGNETASNRFMFRKFMIDSTEFLAKEYKLGGFRFDLMALHDLETMEKLSANLHKINPTFAVYGEPWTGGGTTLPEKQQASQANGNLFNGYAQFNDGMRDALVKSGMKGVTETGAAYSQLPSLVVADMQAMEAGLKGFTKSAGLVQDSSKTVNYVTCHDNYTIDDRILAYEANNENAKKTDEATRAKMNLFAQAFTFLSQGTSFFLAGEEMLRSKYEQTPENLTDKERFEYAHNSYTATEVINGYDANALDYSRKAKYPELFGAYERLIGYKELLEGLHQHIYTTADGDTSDKIVTGHNDDKTYLYEEFKSGDYTYKAIFSSFAGKDGAANIADLSGYSIVFDSEVLDVDEMTPRQGSATETLAKGQVLLARKAA